MFLVIKVIPVFILLGLALKLAVLFTPVIIITEFELAAKVDVKRFKTKSLLSMLFLSFILIFTAPEVVVNKEVACLKATLSYLDPFMYTSTVSMLGSAAL